MDESVEHGRKVDESVEEYRRRITAGFSVGGCPIWLVRELQREAKEWAGDTYWVVIVEWYRKAKEYDNIIRNGLGAPPEFDNQAENQKEKTVTEEPEDGVKLFGGMVGRKR